jgi:hypothetical protein
VPKSRGTLVARWPLRPEAKYSRGLLARNTLDLGQTVRECPWRPPLSVAVVTHLVTRLADLGLPWRRYLRPRHAASLTG